MTRLNALEGKSQKSENSLKIVRSNQHIVMNEEFVKNSVLNAKVDPTVVMEVSYSKFCGWNNLQQSKQNSLRVFMDDEEPWLWIGNPNRDPFLGTQHMERHSASSDHMKKLTSLRESIHVMLQCYLRQHFADRHWLHEHPGVHASWREADNEEIHNRINHALRTRNCVQMEHSEDAIRIEGRRTQKQWASSQTVGEST